MTLVYQAYGIWDVIRQTQFSILSLLKQDSLNERMKVVVYTDQKKYFEDFFLGYPQVEFVEINSHQIAKWRGAINFVHRVKIEILKDAGDKYPGPLFYSDGDTYFTTSPVDLFNQVNDQTSLMHIAENSLKEGKDPLSKKLRKFFRKNKFVLNGKEILVPEETVMWNAGVIGVSEKNKKLFPLILEFTDKTYSQYQKHTMEQLAVSYYLQENSQIFPASKEIIHYWNQKEDFQNAINRFIEENRTAKQALEKWNTFQWPKPPEPKKKFSLFRFLGN